MFTIMSRPTLFPLADCEYVLSALNFLGAEIEDSIPGRTLAFRFRKDTGQEWTTVYLYEFPSPQREEWFRVIGPEQELVKEILLAKP